MICRASALTEQHYVSIFFTRLWSVRKPMLFQYMSSLMTNQQNVIFLLPSFIFACRLVLHLFACTVENPEIPGFCVSKSRGLHIDYKRVKKIETQCCSVTRREDFFYLSIVSPYLVYILEILESLRWKWLNSRTIRVL